MIMVAALIMYFSLPLGSIYETSSQIHQLVPKFSGVIVTGLAKLCMQSLKSANTLPRLYRRTNKDVRKHLL